jgi:glycine cleavage system H protein
MSVPTDRKYLQSHEWFKLDGDVVTVGITQFAADELTDITFVDLPSVGSAITAGGEFGEVESVKATSELLSGVTGEVVEVNAALEAAPELVNDDPFGDGWMVKIKVSDAGELDNLLDAGAYESYCASQG